MTKLITHIALGLSLAAAYTSTATVQANAQTDSISVVVQYADLDLSRTAGAKALFDRIQFASIRACGGRPDSRELRQSADFDQCRKVAIRDAVAQVNSPMLTAMVSHGAQTIQLANR